MLYAKVVLGLPIEGPFDYFVPQRLSGKIKVGSRVWVNLRNKKELGYVVGTSAQTDIKKIKPILDIIDDVPVLDKNLLLLSRKLADYYCCSWGEAIEVFLPQDLRKGKKISGLISPPKRLYNANPEVILVHSPDENARWDFYIEQIRENLAKKLSAILLFSEKRAVLKAEAMIKKIVGLKTQVLYRKQPDELDEWAKIKNGQTKVIIGTRSSIFSPVNDLGLVIIDDEQNSVYKQEQVPHYHAREVALMRVGLEKAKLVLGSYAPSLESIKLCRENKIKYKLLRRQANLAQISFADSRNFPLSDRKNRLILSRYLQDSIVSTLNAQAKTLIFLNRKGFATFATCSSCGKVMKCPRCNINLVYHFYKQLLSCRYCNFKIAPPKICPDCNSGYIKYSGVGTEKVESELSRIFPQGRIKRLEAQEAIDLGSADIFIATQAVIGHIECNFDLVAVLGIDNSLNHVDFRSAEKTYGLLAALSCLTDKKMIIQTSLANHHSLRAVRDYEPDIFYDEELKQRKELRFPPYSHFVLIKCRGRNEEKTKAVSDNLFEKLTQTKLPRTVKVISLNPGQPAKLRGNFYWVILLSCAKPIILSKFIKINLKSLKHSGIIVTVDVDPV
jgi:primosomal protein N' (replication factor Y)